MYTLGTQMLVTVVSLKSFVLTTCITAFFMCVYYSFVQECTVVEFGCFYV